MKSPKVLNGLDSGTTSAVHVGAVAGHRVGRTPQDRATAAGLVLDDDVDGRTLLLQHQLLVARRQVGLAARREGLPVVDALVGAGLAKGAAGGGNEDGGDDEAGDRHGGVP
jgi:hypothetical protein